MFTDQDVIVLDRDGNETGHAGAWCDALDAVAAHERGYAVVINSEPEMIFADYRPADGPIVDHSKCGEFAHSRDNCKMPGSEQTVAADGWDGCNDCGRPLFYCLRTEWYHHVDAAAGCFLAPAWGEPGQVPTAPKTAEEFSAAYSEADAD